MSDDTSIPTPAPIPLSTDSLLSSDSARAPQSSDATPEAPDATSPSVEPPAPLRSRSKGKRHTIQIRTLIERTGIQWKEMKALFSAAGMKVHKLRYLSSINTEEALAALKMAELPLSVPKRNLEAETMQREEADLAAAMRKGKVIDAAPIGTGSGKLSDDPVPQAVLDGDYVEQIDAFPYPAKDRWPADKIISSLNISNSSVAEAHRQAKMALGWRFIDSGCVPLLNDLYPDSRWRRMVNAQGLITSGDLALACFPRAAWEKRKARQRAATPERIAATRETFASNIEDSQRTLQDRHKIPGARHIAPIIEDASTADDRADFESQKAAGNDPRRARVGVGRAATAR